VRVPGNEPSHHFAEWNVYIDAAAAAAVLRSKVPVIFVTLDASDNVPITPFFRDAVQSHRGTAALRLVATLLRDPYYTQAPVYFWDPLAAVAATDRRVVRLQAERLVIGTAAGPRIGVTRVSPAGTPARVAVTASAPAFQRQFLAVLNGGRPLPAPAVPDSRRLAVSFDGAAYRYARAAPVLRLATPTSNNRIRRPLGGYMRQLRRAPADHGHARPSVAVPGLTVSAVCLIVGRSTSRCPRDWDRRARRTSLNAWDNALRPFLPLLSVNSATANREGMTRSLPIRSGWPAHRLGGWRDAGYPFCRISAPIKRC
jgi:Inosine-uridine preferring nucleoside hydrolase